MPPATSSWSFTTNWSRGQLSISLQTDSCFSKFGYRRIRPIWQSPLSCLNAYIVGPQSDGLLDVIYSEPRNPGKTLEQLKMDLMRAWAMRLWYFYTVNLFTGTLWSPIFCTPTKEQLSYRFRFERKALNETLTFLPDKIGLFEIFWF